MEKLNLSFSVCCRDYLVRLYLEGAQDLLENGQERGRGNFIDYLADPMAMVKRRSIC